MVDPVVKKFFDAVMENVEKILPSQQQLDEKIEEVIEEKEKKVKPAKSAAEAELDKAKAAAEDSGYNKKDIEKMNRLIEIIDKK